MEEQNTPLFFPAFDSGSAFEDLRAGHSAIRTTQYDGMIKWYCEALDFRLIREWTSGTMKLAFLALPGDNSFMIEVLGIDPDEKEPETRLTGYDHLCFNVPDLDKTMEALKDRNIEILRCFSIPAIGKRVAFIADPFGNRIEFCENIKQPG